MDRSPLPRSTNAIAHARDARVLWFLAHHPATARMLAEIGWFPTCKKALKRLRRLVDRGQIRLLGTVSLKHGRPEHVYCRGRWKADNAYHEVQLTRLCLKIQAEEMHRGIGDVDPRLRPDAEAIINGQRYFIELDCGTMSTPDIVRTRFALYRGIPDFVLWVCLTQEQMEGRRRHAEMLRTTILFTTLERALGNPHACIWVDVDGAVAALPHVKKGGGKPRADTGGTMGDNPDPFSPPGYGAPTPSTRSQLETTCNSHAHEDDAGALDSDVARLLQE